MRRSSYTILSYLFQSRLIKIPLPKSMARDARDKHKRPDIQAESYRLDIE